jgi:hypothetical protein
MRRFSQAHALSALALGVTLVGSSVAWAGPPKPKQPLGNPYGPAASKPASSATHAAPAAKPAAAPASTAQPAASTDTRGAAMQLYQEALAKRHLAATTPLSRQRLRDELAKVDSMLADGRRDEAIGELVYIVESPRFTPFAESPEGRACVYYLGDALGKAGAYQPARGYLLRVLTGDPKDTWYRRAVESEVDLGLESDEPDVFLADLQHVPPTAPEEELGDIAYLQGRALEQAHKPIDAFQEYAKVTPRSRFWAQATYLSGLIEAEHHQYKQAENLFCKVADPKQTPRVAPLFGGSDFFQVRDLARLGLGRIAHEEFRFDDARYYYYLVPHDSDYLPQALYEAATSRYEAKDYDGARDLMDQYRALKRTNPYQDEAWILDAYIDLGQCKFNRAAKKLATFLARYEPVRDAARRLTHDNAAMTKLVEAVRNGSDPAAAGLGVGDDVARKLAALLRVDSGYGYTSRRLAELDHQMSGLRGAMQDLDEAEQRLVTPKALRPQSATPLGEEPADKIARIDAQLAEVHRLLREVEASGKVGAADVADLQKQLETLEVRARAARAALSPVAAEQGNAHGTDLPDVLQADRRRASELYVEAQKMRPIIEGQQLALAKDALVRLDRRLSRLLRRARLGRVETVLGRKRAMEVEIEALSQGLLPSTIVDSLNAARYLRDDEEYWPFDGEDWADEYVGGEHVK